ncbi:MAG: glycosyltransferase family 2 protein [Fimbriimonadaceae bacterium]|nr:MAG: glycosyltransferase family 2 protein [Fimbriimonadaceae bacterium]
MTSLCVNSLAGSGDLDIFFNGSDGNAEKKLEGDFQVISEAENLAFASAVNLAVQRAANYEFLLFVTNDVTFTPGAVDSLISSMDQNPSIGLLGPLQLVPESLQIHHGGGSFDRKRWKADIHCEDLNEKSGLVFRDWIDGGAMLIRLSAAEKVGPMRPEYGFYWEDVDWGIRFVAAGLPVAVDLNAKVTHASSGTTREFARWKQYIIGRNRGLSARLNLSGSEFQRIARYLRQSMFLRKLRYGTAEKGLVYWAGMRDGLAGKWETVKLPIRDEDPIWNSIINSH